jgi:hypothetical protein
VTRLTDDDPGVTFITVVAVVAIVVGASPPLPRATAPCRGDAGVDEAVQNETKGELQKEGGKNIIF